MTKAKATDFGSLDTAAAAETPYEFELVHPVTKAPLGVFVSVLGGDSHARKAFVRAQINADRRAEFEAQRKGKPREPRTIEQDEADTVDMLAHTVVAWRTDVDGKSEPVIHWQGEKLEFSDANLRKWLAQFPWARAQINEASDDVGNFLKN